MRRFDSALAALAAALAGALWLHQSLSITLPTVGMLVDRTMFLFAATYALCEALRGAAVRLHRSRGQNKSTHAGLAPPLARATHVGRARAAGVVVLAVLIAAQTFLHLDERGAYLYMTYPAFPTGVGTSADGYVAWLDGHPAYAEAWQFAKLANLFSGASTDLETGDHDARGAYAYLAALLARPLGFYLSFLVLNGLFWLGACLATWFLGRALLGGESLGFVAALLTATGQGFVFMSTAPMSYVAGYAWSALLLALAVRWGLFGWAAGWRRWLLWGLVCGASGLFYFTHVVTIGVAWLFGASRAPLRGLLAASAVALLVPALWFAASSGLIGLRFQETTANDLFGQVRVLGRLALAAPLLLPFAAGESSFRALFGGFGVLLLPLAALGVAVAAPRRRQWYVAAAVCGLAPVMILHMIPVTQRYGYLAYPAIYLAAAEATGWIAQQIAAVLRVPVRAALAACATALVAVQVFQANADALGIYRFSLAFGAP